jgi:hypothetical protein
MHRVWLVLLFLLALFCGCTLSRDGSQAIHFNPFGFSRNAVLTPATGGNFVDGERWNYR